MAETFREALTTAGFELAPAPPTDEADAAPGPASLGVDAVQPGVVVLDLDPLMLLADNRVTYTQEPPCERRGPFVCVEVADDGDETTWAGLTFKHRIQRLLIEPAWKVGGSRRWHSRAQYLTDGASLWRGPKDAFAAAAWREVFNGEDEIARLTSVGLEAVRLKIKGAWRRGQETRGTAHAQRSRELDGRRER